MLSHAWPREPKSIANHPALSVHIDPPHRWNIHNRVVRHDTRIRANEGQPSDQYRPAFRSEHALWSELAPVCTTFRCGIQLLRMPRRVYELGCALDFHPRADGLLPEYFARVNRKTQTPARAVAALAALALVSIVTLVLVGSGTLRVWGYMATAGALMYITAYLLAMLALGAYGWETLQNVFMVIAAAIAVPTFAYVIYSAVDPAPAYPLNLWTWVGVGISVVALLVAFVLRMARAPVMATLGRSVQADTLLAAADEANDDFSENGVDRSAASRRP